jgi:hypothetical protein
MTQPVADLWDERRRVLEKAAIDAALNLCEHMGLAGAFKLPIKGTSPEVCLACGSEDSIRSLLTEPDAKHEPPLGDPLTDEKPPLSSHDYERLKCACGHREMAHDAKTGACVMPGCGCKGWCG